MDPEGESIGWSLADGDELAPDDDLFDIENGVLTFKSSPDFEARWAEELTAIPTPT